MQISMEIDHMDVSKNRGTQNGWFIMENPIKIDDLGVPLFLETPACCSLLFYVLNGSCSIAGLRFL